MSRQDSEHPHGPTRLYYESHITIDPVFNEQKEAADILARRFGFRLAKLLMQKGQESELDTFMTAHAKVYEDILERTRSCVRALGDAGFVVRRAKIEDTLLDTRHGDLL